MALWIYIYGKSLSCIHLIQANLGGDEFSGCELYVRKLFKALKHFYSLEKLMINNISSKKYPS